jgi:hypothetical protein
MSVRYLFNSHGKWIAFQQNKYVFDTSGKWMGWMPPRLRLVARIDANKKQLNFRSVPNSNEDWQY